MVERFSYLDQDAWADLDGSRSLTTRRLFGDGIDQPLARLVSGTTSWYLTDRLGSVREIAGGTDGSLVYEATYGGFGDVETEVNPSNGDRYLFTGRERELAFNWYYYRARYYDPVTGRFTGEDTIGFAGGDANLYRYVGNGPTNATDPSGLRELPLDDPSAKPPPDMLVQFVQREATRRALERMARDIEAPGYWTVVAPTSRFGAPAGGPNMIYRKPPVQPFEKYYKEEYYKTYREITGRTSPEQVEARTESGLDALQLALDAAGMIPVIGEVCDGLNAAISAVRGDFLGAALSLVSMVPVLGMASGGIKLARDGARLARKFGQANAEALLKGTGRFAGALGKLDDGIQKATRLIGAAIGAGTDPQHIKSVLRHLGFPEMYLDQLIREATESWEKIVRQCGPLPKAPSKADLEGAGHKPFWKSADGEHNFYRDKNGYVWMCSDPPCRLVSAPGKTFRVGRHGDMPSPRGGTESHHGVMSRWIEEHYRNYNPNNAPAVLMDVENHNATRRVFNAWRAERGGKVDWSKVSEAEIRQLSERMFEAAEVPAAVRAEYYEQFQAFLKTLQKK